MDHHFTNGIIVHWRAGVKSMWSKCVKKMMGVKELMSRKSFIRLSDKKKSACRQA